MNNLINSLQKLDTGNHTWLLIFLTLLVSYGESHRALAKGNDKPSIVRANYAGNRSVKKLHKHAVIHRVTKPVIRAKTTKKANTVPSMSLPGAKNVVSKDHKLQGAVYYLVSGHGGPDPGAIGHYGKYALAEDEYAYDVTIRLARALMQHGATTYMIVRDPNDGIRDEKVLKLDHDEVTYPNQKIPLNQTKRLRQCTDAVNKLHRKHNEAYQRMVTIHVDSRSEGQNIDVFFYHHEASKVGKKLAKYIHKSFKSGYKRSQPTRSYSGTVSDRSSLYVVKNSHPPTVFIELGNIRNGKDQQRFLLADNRQALANWICSGLEKDYRSH